MVTATDCSNCIHTDVCGLKTRIKETEAKLNEIRTETIHPDINILIQCRKFYNKNELNYQVGVRHTSEL